MNDVRISDRVESIGPGAFSLCAFTTFRSPPLVITIPYGMLGECRNLLSLELPEKIICVKGNACFNCHSLRNVALASNTVVEENAFMDCLDLLHIFDTEKAIIDALRIRFVGLLIHSLVYYKSYYHHMSVEEFCNAITIGENGELNPSGLQQDCLGMTPLHILTCSTVHHIEIYQVMVVKYPESLIVEDAWGATPLLYAIWGDSPSEIVHFLVDRYQSLYPDHEFDWSEMVFTLGRADASEGVIQNLLHIQQTLSPGYSIDWVKVLEGFAIFPSILCATAHCTSSETFCFLTRCSIATRINAIGVKHFRNAMVDDWMGDDDGFNSREWYNETLAKLEYYESEYQRLKEVTSLLELALWKARIGDASVDYVKAMEVGNKKMKMGGIEFRVHCRISCGAEHVLENVLPYLLPPDFVRSRKNSDDDEEDEDTDSDDFSVIEDTDDDDDGGVNDNDDNIDDDDESEDDDNGED